MRIWVGLAALLFGLHPVAAHEIRPAYLEIQETVDHGYEVLWKQPVMGEIAVHLVPHLSGGWLDGEPKLKRPTTSFELIRWEIPADRMPPLPGQIVSIEGLENTITDTLVVVRAHGTTWQTLLTPTHTSQQLDFQAVPPPLALPLFVKLGFEHILTGPDHLLFLAGLILILRDRWMLFKTLTAFTVAHSLTLGLATLNYVRAPVTWIEVEIALSILFLALETVRAHRGRGSFTIHHPWCVAFLFGLLHGFGFAGGLSAAGLPPHDIPAALLLFNVGVEIGQLTFVASVLMVLYAVRLLKISWRPALGLVPRYAMGSIAALWTLERLTVLLGNS